MKLSNYFIDTLREDPSDAEVISQKLMLRASMIKKLASGIYTYLPLGLRVLRKVEKIVRDSMNKAGGIELLMPAVQPAELWQESGRWDFYGKELLRLKDRHNRDFCIGPTHEEIITDIVRTSIRSYKQLPLTFYQIQTKFRDEVRPRFGIMRAREFIMKDAYSFDVSDEAAEISYRKMDKAYREIFEKCGLTYKVVDADSGAIGGSFSHEFMVTAETGEDDIVSCNSCDYSANIEKATVIYNTNPSKDIKCTLEKVLTPNAHTVEEVRKFLSLKTEDIVKSMLVRCDDKFYIILIRGDRELNLAKFKNMINSATCELATAKEVVEVTKGDLGFTGPIGIDIPIYADNEIKDMINFVTGANEKDMHYINVNFDTDFKVESFNDFRNASESDICPKCGGRYVITRGIEVGHIFKLGTKYSEKMKAHFIDNGGKGSKIVMGCYGIGVGRIAAAAIEQLNDEKGILWPKAIAPFEIVIVPMSNDDAEVNNLSNKLYDDLLGRGIDVVLDDRDERGGVKLKDAELIGYPIYITVGKKSVAEGYFELTVRNGLVKHKIEINDSVNKIVEILDFIG